MKPKRTAASSDQKYRINYTLRYNMPFIKKGKLIDKKENKVKERFFEAITQITTDLPIENFVLFITKYIPLIKANLTEPKGKVKDLFNLDTQSIGGESKKPFLNGLIRKFNAPDSFNISGHDIMALINKRMEKEVESLIKSGYISIFQNNSGLKLITQSRLIVGLGAVHPLETSLTLHHIFGIPYIPGSALKGVCRMVAFWKIAKEKRFLEDISDNKDKLKFLQNRFNGSLVEDDELILRYQILFGAQDFKGLLLFLDAYPEVPQDGRLFELDVMNVHYPKYYSGNEPPGDWQNPNPIFFLTVKKKRKFHFHVMFDQYRYNRLPDKYKKLINQDEVVSDVKEIIESALKEFGIGAKTRLGYGMFE